MGDSANPVDDAGFGNTPAAGEFRVAGWDVHPSLDRLSRGPETLKLEPKVMQVLVYLARRQGQVVTRDELAEAVWAGTIVGDDAVTNAVIKLRRAFGDDSRVSRIIQTIPKRGYRLVAQVEPPAGTAPGTGTPAHSTAASAPPAIAVLPFRNLSADPEQEYFSDGITEDLIIALTNTGWYFVIARDSAFSYKDKAVDVREVGKELDVQYILQGSVRRMGDQLRVTAQLIETDGGKQVWGKRYDGEFADVFDFQDHITEAIVATVEGEFQRVEGDRASQKRPDSMAAYDHLLRGLACMNKLTPEDTRAALDYFYKAIEKDPNYARAYAYAFWCYRRQVQLSGMVLSVDEQAEAVRLMNAGLKADRTDPVVLWQAASLKNYFERDFEGALALLERSLEIDPNSPRAWNTSAEIHGFMGRGETSREHAEHSLRMSPRSLAHWVAHTQIAAAYLQEARYQEAADAAKKALPLNDYCVLTHLIVAASCAHLDRLDEARAAVARSLELNEGLTVTRLPELYPIARYANLDAFLDGLRRSGLPE